MKSVDDIEQSIRELNITVGPELHDRVLGSLLKTMEESKKQSSAVNRPSIWRIIMENRMTRFATAAVIIIAVLIGINQFGGSIDGASMAFAAVKEAMKSVPWMQVVNNTVTGEEE